MTRLSGRSATVFVVVNKYTFHFYLKVTEPLLTERQQLEIYLSQFLLPSHEG